MFKILFLIAAIYIAFKFNKALQKHDIRTETNDHDIGEMWFKNKKNN